MVFTRRNMEALDFVRRKGIKAIFHLPVMHFGNRHIPIFTEYDNKFTHAFIGQN
jgi:hypothetical protein